MEISFFIIFIIFHQHSHVTADQACESGQSEHDGSCYYFSKSESNFASSKSSCKELGMHLVYIGSQEEQSFLQESLYGNKEKHWIGLLSRVKWLDGSSVTYSQFKDNSDTSDEGGVCFAIEPKKSYKWKLDNDCSESHEHHYICEKEEGIQSSSEQQTTTGAATSPEGTLTQTTPNQMTPSETPSSTTHTDIIVTTSGSTQPSSTTDDAISETISSVASTTPTSHAPSTSTTGHGLTDAASPTSEQATDTTPATTSTHTTQTMSSTTSRSSSRDRGHMSVKTFRLLAGNVALIDAYVLSSYTVSSVIECSQLCLADVPCSCYTYIACEGLCLLGKECLATSTFAFERRTGAKFYSALFED